MGRIEKTVFISYRRTNVSWALAISQNLTQNGFDVFFDFTGIASGDFERVILENIRARAHFLVLLTPSALERCGDPTDWLRREIETALGARRNVVPLMLEGFDFGTPAIANHLAGKLAELKKYNALSIPPQYFVQAMERLRDEFLKVPLDAVLHPASQVAQQAATEQKDAAAKAPAVAEEELVEKEREQAAAEKARLEQLQRDHKTSEEEASLADVKSRRATARQFHLVRARKPTPEVIGPLTRKYPAWMKVGIAVGAVLLIGSLLYWAASRSGDKGSEAQKPETQATPNQDEQPQTITLPQTAALTSSVGTIEGKVSTGNSVVYADTTTIPRKTFPAPAEKAVMDQVGLEFKPHVMVIQQGTTVEFLNSDVVQHNVFWPSIGGKKNEFLNLGTWSKGEKRTYKFDTPGVAELLCNVHPEMSAYIVISPTPYFAKTDASGSYKIENVPNGTYVVVAWNERTKQQTKLVDVAGTSKVDFSLSK